MVGERGQTEPWFLSTTLTDPKSVKRLEGQRMRVEPGIGDRKRLVFLCRAWG
ncbi:MAG: hypothetical protein RMK49_20900 [Abditibacteriales bacterium]|nr:hypothetical protein [Abditibacteriales bacterium]